MTDKLIRNEKESIEAIKSNMPKSGYYMLRESLEMVMQALEEIQQYRAIGSVEECRAAVENYRPRVTNAIPIGNKYYICSRGSVVKDGEKCLRCGDTIDRTEEGEK